MDPLPVPSPLTASWAAPHGDFLPPVGTVNVRPGAGIIDLTACRIFGSGTGMLFKTVTGADFELALGYVENVAGLVMPMAGLGGYAHVVIREGVTHNVRNAANPKSNDGSRVDVEMYDVTGDGWGAGIRPYGSAIMARCNLVGGQQPSSGEATACRALDLNDTGTVVDDQVLEIIDCDLSDFIGTNADDAGGEESVRRATVVGNVFDTAGESLLDIKCAEAFIVGNILRGSVGPNKRMVAIHAGHAYLGGNVFTVPDGVSAIQATGEVTTDDDTFYLGVGSYVARADVACSGSTGFPAGSPPRVGNIRVRRPRLVSQGSPPVKIVKGTCGGVSYTPTVTID